jgi:hypothetical protein
MGAIDLSDDTGVQLGHQIGKAQIHLSRTLKIIPRQNVQVRSGVLKDERFAGSRTATIPSGTVAFFVFNPKCDRVLERDHLKATIAQDPKDALIQQEVVWIACDPER